jgi:GntR family transcriptional regulator
MAHAALTAAIDENLAVPLYHQVYLVLRENIRNGSYGDGAIPPEGELCNEFGVSRITIKRAMQELTKDDLITRQRGRGTFVKGTPLAAVSQRDSLDQLLKNVMAIGAATEMRRLDSGLVRAAADVAEKLNCPAGTEIFAANQVRVVNGTPIALIRAFVPADIAAKLTDRDTSALPMLAQLQRADIAVTKAEQAITATLADPGAAAALRVDVGAPLIRLTRRITDSAHRPVEWLVALYRADRYEYRTTMTRETVNNHSAWAQID